MSDIVALARRHRHIAATHYAGCEAEHIGCLVGKLADEVERLRADLLRLCDEAIDTGNKASAEVERLREALRKIASERYFADECAWIAHKALEGAP